MRSNASCALHRLQDRRTQADRCILRTARFLAEPYPLAEINAVSPRSRHSHKDPPTTTCLFSSPAQYVHESILGRMNDNLPSSPADCEFRQHHVGNRVVIPALTWRLLVVPFVTPRVRVNRNDRGDEQVVALALRSQIRIPGEAISCCQIELIEIRIENQGVPNVTTAAQLVPVAKPGRCGNSSSTHRRKPRRRQALSDLRARCRSARPAFRCRHRRRSRSHDRRGRLRNCR